MYGPKFVNPWSARRPTTSTLAGSMKASGSIASLSSWWSGQLLWLHLAGLTNMTFDATWHHHPLQTYHPCHIYTYGWPISSDYFWKWFKNRLLKLFFSYRIIQKTRHSAVFLCYFWFLHLINTCYGRIVLRLLVGLFVAFFWTTSGLALATKRSLLGLPAMSSSFAIWLILFQDEPDSYRALRRSASGR